MLKKKFKNWCDKNLINAIEISDHIYQVGDQKFLLVEGEDDCPFNSDFEILLSHSEELKVSEVDHFVYFFGTRFCYSPVKTRTWPEVSIFKHLGEATTEGEGYPFLGVHGPYEILTGSRFYKDWVRKAKFLKVPTLGICEKNTLGGALLFQEECDKKKVKPIIGETITIKVIEDQLYEGKIYAINQKGWENMLLINTEINVNNTSQYVDFSKLLELSEGLVFVFNPLMFPFDLPTVRRVKKAFKYAYVQLDSVEYESEQTDRTLLLQTQEYLCGGVEPILICDAYYLDQEDYEIKPSLEKISGHRGFLSKNQHFKTDDENLIAFDSLFKEEDFGDVVGNAIANLEMVAELCTFKIELGKFKLPRYKMNPEEAEVYETNEDLFYDLVVQNLEEKGILNKENSEEYLQRVDTELEVIELGGFIDYFLILWDIQNYCKKNDILTGLGRGSAAGCLIAYLLDIVRVDPLEYHLLFERFLNKGRIGKSLPDIDTDFESNRKEDVKKYMENKYGHDKVCSVGTYTTLQMRAAFNDFCKLENVPIEVVRHMSNLMFEVKDDKNARASKNPWEYVFKLATRNKVLMAFVQEHAPMFELTYLCHAQPRASSVHACATVILPENESIFTSIPIRRGEINGMEMLVSEWEGVYLESAGYLKEDILGVTQLDKFRMIVDLVKENYGEDVDIYSIPLDQPEVYEMFSQGNNGDVFHLGSKGLTQYCTQVHPETVDDLTAMLALYRPGPIQNNFHSDFVLLRHGEREPNFFEGTETITKNTYGLFAYQEQIMQTCQVVAGFNLVEADDVRKAMGKLNKKLLASYEDRFKAGGKKNGYTESYLDNLWETLLKFGGYSFNKSHSVCYAITGYHCQYLKWKYPLPYWITALEFSNDETVLRYISEIYNTGSIRILPPDINKSRLTFFADFDRQEIVWSINKVKQVGEIGVQMIFEERDKNGEFFSLSEFLTRVDKSKVNKSVVENLICSGAFDEIENLQSPAERRILIERYRTIMGTKISKKDRETEWFTVAKETPEFYEDWWWLLRQKSISGLAFIDYNQILDKLYDTDFKITKYLSLGDFQKEDLSQGGKVVLVTGVVTEVQYKGSKKGDYCKIRLEQNYNFAWVTIWSDIYEKYKDKFLGIEGKIMIVQGRSYYDTYKQENAVQSDNTLDFSFLG